MAGKFEGCGGWRSFALDEPQGAGLEEKQLPLPINGPLYILGSLEIVFQEQPCLGQAADLVIRERRLTFLRLGDLLQEQAAPRQIHQPLLLMADMTLPDREGLALHQKFIGEASPLTRCSPKPHRALILRKPESGWAGSTV